MKPKSQIDTINETYNTFKEFEGKSYTGMKIGRSHSWIYEPGSWKETKVAPDKWVIDYSVTKKRKGRAPEGSGVPVGTKYHWYILAHQIVEKLNANDYSTEMVGIKYKIAHQRANKESWNISEQGQKKRLLMILQDLIHELENDISKSGRKQGKIQSPKLTQVSTLHESTNTVTDKNHKKAG